MLIKIIKQITFLILSSIIGYFFGHLISYNEVKEVLSSLQNLSAAVFALAGLWIAYIYPKAIAAITTPSESEWDYGDDSTLRIQHLILSIFSSAFVLVSILMFNYMHSLFNGHPVIQSNIEIYNMVILAFVTYVSIIQIITVLSIMSTNIAFVNKLFSLQSKKNAQEELDS